VGKSGFHGAFVLIGGSFAARSPASAALAAFEDFRVELNKGLSDAWDSYYDGSVQKSCSDEAALARMGALAAIEHACVHLAGAASLADSADFESKRCVRSILDV